MRNSPLLLRLGIAAAATSLISGCSALSTSSSSALSGSQLAGILLPASSMPKGYKVNTSSTINSGSQLPSDTARPIPASKLCETFTETAYIRAAGIQTGDFAQKDYINASQSGEIAEQIDIFTGTDAQKTMTKLWQDFGKCSSFSYHSNGTTVPNTLRRSRIPGEGDDAIKAVIMSPDFDGGGTLVAIRVGSQIITTLDTSSGSDMGSPAVGYAEQIAKRLQAAG